MFVRRSVVALLLLLAAGCAPPVADTANSPEDEAAIRKTIARAVEAFNSSDIETLIQLHTDDAVILKPGKAPEIGKQVMRTSYEQVFSSFQVNESRTVEEIEIVGDLAFTWGYYSVTLTPADGSPPADEKGKYIDVLHRQLDGSWLFARTMWNVTAPE